MNCFNKLCAHNPQLTAVEQVGPVLLCAGSLCIFVLSNFVHSTKYFQNWARGTSAMVFIYFIVFCFCVLIIMYVIIIASLFCIWIYIAHCDICLCTLYIESCLILCMKLNKLFQIMFHSFVVLGYWIMIKLSTNYFI